MTMDWKTLIAVALIGCAFLPIALSGLFGVGGVLIIYTILTFALLGAYWRQDDGF